MSSETSGRESSAPARLYEPSILHVREELPEFAVDDLASRRLFTDERFRVFHRYGDDRVDIGDVTIETDAGALRLRTYSPRAGYDGGLLWVHGGAFSLGSPEMDDDVCRDLADRHGRIVVSPDYRMAPEHPYPAAEVDCTAAHEWLLARLAAVSAGRGTVIGGSSAGGALALATAMTARERDENVERLVLLYPVVDSGNATESMKRYRSAPIFDGAQADLMWRRYLAGSPSGARPSPLSDPRLRRLPETLVVLTEHDPLRDEGLELVSRLLSVRVPVQALLMAGTYHSYERFAPDSPRANQLRRAIDEFLEMPPLVESDW